MFLLKTFESSVPTQLQPLEGAVGDVVMGGRSLSEWREGVFQIFSDCEVAENAWVTVSDAAQMMTCENAQLVDAAGSVLVRRGDGSGEVLTVSSESFFVRYAWDLLKVNAQILNDFSESGGEAIVHPAAHVDGVLIAGADTKILPGVYIEGIVVIGKNCKIGPNCYIRGATSIADNCHVGQSVEIKNSILGSGTNVGHLSYLGDSVLGDKVNFGAGTTTSNLRHDNANHSSLIDGELIDTGLRKFGTVIGSGVHTGIHTAIYPGRKIAARASTLPNATVTKDIVA